MKVAITLVFVACAIASAYGACLTPGITSEKRDNDQCYWYNDNSCCDADTIAIVTEGAYACKVEEGCKDQYNLYFCGVACSPEISSAIDTSAGAIRVCSKFIDKVYSSCKSSEFNDESGNCKKLGDQYSSGKDWIERGGGSLFVYDENDSSPTCFNAGSVAQPAFVMGFLAIVATLLLKI